jgi:predicted nucleic acid-binding protein
MLPDPRAGLVSELRKPRPHGEVVAWIKHSKDEQLFLSVVTMAELQGGTQRTRRQDASKADDMVLLAAAAFQASQVLGCDDRALLGCSYQ